MYSTMLVLIKIKYISWTLPYSEEFHFKFASIHSCKSTSLNFYVFAELKYYMWNGCFTTKYLICIIFCQMAWIYNFSSIKFTISIRNIMMGSIIILYGSYILRRITSCLLFHEFKSWSQTFILNSFLEVPAILTCMQGHLIRHFSKNVVSIETCAKFIVVT